MNQAPRPRRRMRSSTLPPASPTSDHDNRCAGQDARCSFPISVRNAMLPTSIARRADKRPSLGFLGRRSRNHVDGTVAWPTTEQVNDLIRPPANSTRVNDGVPTRRTGRRDVHLSSPIGRSRTNQRHWSGRIAGPRNIFPAVRDELRLRSSPTALGSCRHYPTARCGRPARSQPNELRWCAL